MVGLTRDYLRHLLGGTVAVGYMYILSNASMGDLLKIGYTCGSVDARAKELAAATGVPSEFVVEYFYLTSDVETVEQLAHEELAPFRHNTRREFFAVSITEALNTIQRHLRKPKESYLRSPDHSEPLLAPSTCHRCGAAFTRSTEMRYCAQCEF